MEIRFARHGDIPEIVRLGGEIHAESRLLGLLPYASEETTRMAHRLLDDRRGVYCILIARSGSGALAGVLGGMVERQFFSRRTVAHNIVFYVDARYRGSSAAIRLLKAFRNWAAKRGAAQLRIHQDTGIEPERFRRFMCRLGFASAGENFLLTVERGRL